jgi:hypothetical protein
MEPRTSHMPGKLSTTELHPQAEGTASTKAQVMSGGSGDPVRITEAGDRQILKGDVKGHR